MTELLESTFRKADAASQTLADYVSNHESSWRVDQTTLSTIRAACYADGLNENWRLLTDGEKERFFSSVEDAVALEPDEPLGIGTSDDPGSVWCTGFLEALSNYLDEGTIPLDEALRYLGPESLAYLNAWNEFNGVKLYPDRFAARQKVPE